MAQTGGDKGIGYRLIADALRDQIRSGEYFPGAFLPTEAQLQETYGVSRSTVRRALSALAESGWAIIHPKRGVAACSGADIDFSGSIAYIDHADLVNSRVFFGIGRALQETSLHLVHVDSRVYGVEGAIEYAVENGFLGAYVWSKSGFPDLERIEAAQRKLPLIALDHRLGKARTDLVAESNLEGAAEAVRHLARQGCRRIAVSGMMDMLEVNHDRFSGYLKGLFDSGLTPHSADFLFCVTSGYGPEETSLLHRRLNDADRPDAIFVLQDMCVPTVVEAVFDCGLKVPEDVKIAAFGGEVPIQIDGAGLTSMVVDWHEYTRRCVQALLERLRRPTKPCEELRLPTTLVVRGSCGAKLEQWDPDPTVGVEIHLGSRWKLEQEYLQIRSDGTRRLQQP